jgi:hypothetical protein
MEGVTIDSMGMVSMVTPNESQGLQSLLQTQFNDTGITVNNHATGGTSSSLENEMLGMDGNGAPFAQRIGLSPASIVIDNHAVNDALGGETLAEYQGYLVQWIESVRAVGKTPVLEEPNPVCDGQHPQLAAYVQAMDDAAAEYGVPLISQYNMILSTPDWQSHMIGCFYPDAYIDSLKAAQEYAVIGPLVKSTAQFSSSVLKL